uniref:Gamma-aminobutyric acid type B receptor subunit 1 n=1 Tax=Chelonoidis abingdonii TaxID=106734 RepID=A0A8C0IQ30_CHEAB
MWGTGCIPIPYPHSHCLSPPPLQMLLLLLSVVLIPDPAGGCEIIHPPRDGGIRYRGLTPDQVQTVRFLPFDYEIEYVCRPDREIVGPKVRKCLPNGTWTEMGHASRCSVRTCPKIHLSLENGQAVPRSMERVPVEGTWVEYHCNPGFRLVGSARSNCTKVGRWSFPKPICECESGCLHLRPRPNSPPGPPSDWLWRQGLWGESEAMYVGLWGQRCMGQGQWSGPGSVCVCLWDEGSVGQGPRGGGGSLGRAVGGAGFLGWARVHVCGVSGMKGVSGRVHGVGQNLCV